ncbi:unnamed protein product [Parnassius mnemosyne]|uniref:poly(ADP-ribose) glycohydrolase n=1 Tax=Parnassius mnemosyne TaxID=213953 RepID=A0AAV1M2F1_9NEOP
MSHSNDWIGAPLSLIYGSETPWGAPEFPPVQPGHNHAVLYHIPSNGVLAEDRPPKPQIGQDRWDQHHVRLPCSKQSLYPVPDNKGGSRLRKRWAIIENALKRPIQNSEQLANAILAYNTKFKSRWKFRALHRLFNECLEEEESQYFFNVTLPDIIKLALDLPTLVQAPIPLLKQHKNISVSLSQQQIASLLANAFFCTFPRRNSLKQDSEYASYPFINFNSLYEASPSDDVIEKLKCICHYFRRVCTKVPVGVVTFTRRSVPPRSLPQWAESTRPIATLPLHVDSYNTIEEADGLIQLDFANKYLGGGVLGHGCVQEEIRFVICPELMVSMLFTEVLRPNEAVMIIGGERYSRYVGYGHTFAWAGEWHDTAPRDCSGRRRVALLALDALQHGAQRECSPHGLARDLHKAWVGFSFNTDNENEGMNFPGIATGNWGCGAFGGTPQLKSLLQIMACAQSRRPMAYYTFKDSKLRDEIMNMYSQLVKHHVTVGQLYRLLVRFCNENLPTSCLHSFLLQVLKDDASSTTLKMESTKNEAAECLKITDMLKNELLDSPDLFSLDVTMDEDNNSKEKLDSSNKNLEEKEQTQDKMAEDKKMADINLTEQSNQTSRLFQEMEKLDEGNGSLNLNSTHSLSFGYIPETSSCSDGAMDADKIQMDMSVEVKKKISRKITDYFAKKPI